MSDAPDFTAPAANGDRDGTIARFYVRPVQNNFKSQQAGRPIFEDQEFVEIHVPGDRKTVVDTHVKEEHRRRWPRAYAAFKEGREAPLEGTALSEWAGITASQVEELRFSKVLTVEQLAALSDDQLNKTIAMGGFKLRASAQRFLEQATGSAPMERLAAENEVLKATLDETNRTLTALQAEVARLSAKAAEPSAPPPQV